MKRARLVGVAMAALALAGAASVGRFGASPSQRTEALPERPELTWAAPGGERVYALRWTVSRETGAAAAPGALPLSGQLDVDVAVGTVSAVSAQQDKTVLVFAVRAVRAHEIRVAGAAVVGDGNDGVPLVGQQALVTIDRRGAVQSTAFRPGTEPQAREVLERIVRAMQVTLPLERAASWEAVEPAPSGMARARYAVSADSDRVVRRQRLAYLTTDGGSGAPPSGESARDPNLRGEATIRLDADGSLASIEDDEERDQPEGTTHSAVTIHRQGDGRFDRVALDPGAFSEARPVDARTGFDPHAHDERISASVSWDVIEGQVLANDVGRPLARGFMARAGAYLRLHPEETGRVARWFEDRNANVRTRQMLVDLLSVAGDAPAQSALRDVLASPEAKADGGAYALYVQRFAFLERPEPESAGFVAAAMRDALARGDEKAVGATAAALGGMVRTLRHGGRSQLADQHHAELVRALDNAPSAPRRVDLVRALGNAAVAGDADRLAPFARDADGMVRDQVAYALRHMDSPRARSLLLDLAADPLAAAAISAVRALGSQSMDEAEWAELQARVEAGRTNLEADSTLARMVAANRSSARSHGVPILRAILARVPPGDIDLRASVETFLRAGPPS